MPVTIDGSNTPTAGGVVYGDGTEYASTAAGTSGQVLLSNGSSAPTWGTAGTATTATNLAGGSAGTVPYQSASGTTAMLAAGTSGQVLTSSGTGAPSWTTPSAGAMTFITSVTASSSATVDLENAMTGYDMFMITFTDVYATGGSAFRMQFKIGGSYQTNFFYSYSYLQVGGTGTTNSSQGYIGGITFGTTSARVNHGVLYLPNPSSTATYKSIFGQINTNESASTNFNIVLSGQWVNSTSALTGVRFYMNSGNITAGTFRLYGIKNS